MANEKEILFKPKELYTKTLRQQYHDAAVAYFDKLSEQGEVNPPENSKHVALYNELKAKQAELKNSLSSNNALKGFLIFLIVLFFITGTVFVILPFFNVTPIWLWIVLGVLLIGGGIGFIILIAKKINSKARTLKDKIAKLEIEIANALRVCYEDMKKLNALFDWNAPAAIMEATTPIIDLDPIFTVGRFAYMHQKYGLLEEDDPNTSVLGVVSGEIQGNPFILEKVLQTEYGPKTYHGSRVVTWTTTHVDSKGNTYTETHSETLHASVEHDAPFYYTNTRLIYGNEAAPHLSFSRRPHPQSSSEGKDREKAIKKGMKDINKMAEKAITSGGSFTPTGNDAFDVFFGANDRDNEVEFRLLFTPLAQANMMELLSDPNPFGDDFIMVKNKMVNSIASRHSQNFDYLVAPSFFRGYDHARMKEIFVSYCDDYIRNLFFDLAPLLSIPLYQMHKSKEYIYDEDRGFRSNITSYEHEVMANSMDQDLFAPAGASASLPLLLKATLEKKDGKTDKVNIHAFSYIETPRVDYVPVLCRNGHYYDVPVEWTQYDRVDSDAAIGVKQVGGSEAEYRAKQEQLKDLAGAYFQRGLLAFLYVSAAEDMLDKKIDTIFLPSEKLG